ncbi:MAG: glycosyltransferase family 2 protein [Ferrimicrobium sp.]
MGDLAVVVPVYQGGSVAVSSVIALQRELEMAGLGDTPIWVVDDGSTDGTAERIRSIGGTVQLLRLARNVGKGNALRVGSQHCTRTYVAFFDGDGDISPAAVVLGYRIARASDADLVYGSKVHPGSRVSYPLLRRPPSALARVLSKLATRGAVRDSQSGCKVLRLSSLMSVVHLLRLDGFAFDLELCIALLDQGFTRIVEAPIRVEKNEFSVPVVQGAYALLGLVKLALRSRCMPGQSGGFG